MYSYVVNIKTKASGNDKKLSLYHKLAAAGLEKALIVSDSECPVSITLYAEYETIQEADKLLPKLQEIKANISEEHEITVFVTTNKLTL